MKDGHLNKCKKCCKRDALKNRIINIEKVREYDRIRSKEPHRRTHTTNNTRKWRLNNPEKWSAQKILHGALRKGKITKQSCCVCGSIKSQAHHEDYSKPLDVIWVCALHHHEIHAH